MVLGPFKRADVFAAAANMGDMGLAQINAVKAFMENVMGMSREEVRNAAVREACWTSNDCLLVKFNSIAGARTLNKFKKNLPKDMAADDFVPPCMRDWEDVLIRYGDQLRANRQQGHPQVKTRRVWLKGTRVLQVRYSPGSTFQNVLGLQGLGRQWYTAEMNMLLKSFDNGLPDVDVQPPTDHATLAAQASDEVV